MGKLYLCGQLALRCLVCCQVCRALPRCSQGVLLAKRLFLGDLGERQTEGRRRPVSPPYQALATSSGRAGPVSLRVGFCLPTHIWGVSYVWGKLKLGASDTWSCESQTLVYICKNHACGRSCALPPFTRSCGDQQGIIRQRFESRAVHVPCFSREVAAFPVQPR